MALSRIESTKPADWCLWTLTPCTSAWNLLRSEYPNDLVRSADNRRWHNQEAIAAEAVRDWFAAVFHLTHLIGIGSSQSGNVLSELYARRGRAWAEQRQWKEAAEDFGAALKAGSDAELTLTAYALTLLASGDREGYREACANLLDQYGETAHSESAWRLVWVSILDSTPVKGMPSVALDSSRADGGHEIPACQIAHAATLVYRGQCEQALAVLNEARVFAESIDAVRCWLLLATVHHRLGNDMEAERWLRQSQLWIGRNCDTHPKALGNRPPKVVWEQRLELELFLSEVERAMKVTATVPRIEKIPN